MTLDEWLTGQGDYPIDLIKLDVEGVEERSLRGMRGTMEKHRPAMLIEVLELRPGLMQELEHLVRLGYRFLNLDEKAKVELRDALERPPEERNLLLVPESRREECLIAAARGPVSQSGELRPSQR